MGKLIIHIGLPKTATTSFQINVLWNLHIRKNLNFLGRYKTKNDKDYFNPFEKVFFSLHKSNCLDNNQIKEYIDKIIQPQKINIISEESLILTHHRKHDLVLKNLSILFKKYNPIILITLRNPIELLYSLYVELYPVYFYLNPDEDSLEKYVKNILQSPNDPKFDIHFYGRLLEKISNNFKNIRILLYEDIKYDPETYFGTLGELLDEDPLFLKNFFLKKKLNVKKEGKKGKISEPITLDKKIRKTINLILPDTYKNKIKDRKIIYNMYRSLQKFAQRVKFSSGKEIKLNFEKESLIRLFQEDLKLLYERFDIEKKKLTKYNYI